jgi:hypothetical protein
MADVVRVSFPIRFHLGEKIGSIDSLRLTDCSLNPVSFQSVELAVISAIKPIKSGCDRFDGLVLIAKLRAGEAAVVKAQDQLGRIVAVEEHFLACFCASFHTAHLKVTRTAAYSSEFQRHVPCSLTQ